MLTKAKIAFTACLCAATIVSPLLYSAPLTTAQETASKEWNYSLALQAASWGAPLVTMYALRHLDAVGPHAKARPNTIWRMEDISTPALSQEAGYVTPNVNVVYGFGFMDLRQEPIVLEAPIRTIVITW